MKPFENTGKVAASIEECSGSKKIQNLWHARLGHASKETIRKTIPLVKGIKLERPRSIEGCVPCKKAKSTRSVRSAEGTGDKEEGKPLELAHSDVVGLVETVSLGGASYFITLYDDKSSISLLRFFKKKSQAGECLKDMIMELETVFGKSKVKKVTMRRFEPGSNGDWLESVLKRVRTDNAKEFLSETFRKWLSERGTVHELSSAYSPESNGKAERLNRTLMEIARSMLLGMNQVKNYQKLWAEAVNTANYLRNRMYNSVCCNSSKTPFEVITGRKPDLTHLRVFDVLPTCTSLRQGVVENSALGLRKAFWSGMRMETATRYIFLKKAR